jgi:hypothetical protein
MEKTRVAKDLDGPWCYREAEAAQFDIENFSDRRFPGWEYGAANRTRTCDPVITNDVLYQLSYCGEPNQRSGATRNART